MRTEKRLTGSSPARPAAHPSELEPVGGGSTRPPHASVTHGRGRFITAEPEAQEASDAPRGRARVQLQGAAAPGWGVLV